MTEIKPLSKTIISPKGLAGFTLKQVYQDDDFYIYEKVNTEFNYKAGYELFERRVNTMFKCETVPGGEAFGIWAFQLPNLNKAYIKLRQLKQEKLLNEKK